MADRIEPAYFRYWGKARKEGGEGAPYHLLPYHCLDVAAVGAAYLAQHKALAAGWAKRLQIDEKTLADWLLFFLSQHDLGKFSYRFQGLRPDLAAALGNPPGQDLYGHPRHDTLGHLLWGEAIWPLAAEQAWFGDDATDSRHSRLFDILARLATGHHGKPPQAEKPPLVFHFTDTDQQAARSFAADCAALFLPKPGGAIDTRVLHKRLKPLSWWLAGLAVLCDWLGSSEDYFKYRGLPYDGEALPLRDYWHKHALPQAEFALADIGLLPRRVRPQTFAGLFDYLQPKPPTPLQRTAADMPLAAGPQLFILEDVTGAGKTEAALMLAHRLMAAGEADGFYFGLPTMATSNAMFRRIVDKGLDGKFYWDKPNRILAHSASRLEPVLDALLAGGGGDADYGRGEESAASQRRSWFADSRKKALLADIGVGTLDQALLAVLYSKHQSLRLLGLARKVLIVDEVHACDAYMLKLLEALLAFHSAAGGSAILLSATLPHASREKLARTYRAGLDGGMLTLHKQAYPLLTCIGLDEPDEIPLDTRPEVARTVELDWLYSLDEAVALLLEARNADRCACWIRNTVDDAIAAFEALQKAGVPEDDLLLFHARFALGDRLKIETEALKIFGPDSIAAQRRGKILICTQVLESSVDADLDVMLSDLAPVDLLIQRAGRLCRHVRNAAGNRAERDGRGRPKLWLFGPEFAEQPAADWLSKSFAGTAAVYPDHGRLWLTVRLLRESGHFTMPDDARHLIEGVYGDESDAAMPEALQARAYKVEGENYSKQSVADANTVKLEGGYVQQGCEPWDDTRIPTRLEDQPSVTLRLACWESGAMRPWLIAERCAWELSQLSVRVSLFADEAVIDDPVLREAVEMCRQAMPDKGRWSKLLVLRWEDGAWLGQGKNKKGEPVVLRYDERLGLRLM